MTVAWDGGFDFGIYICVCVCVCVTED